MGGRRSTTTPWPYTCCAGPRETSPASAPDSPPADGTAG